MLNKKTLVSIIVPIFNAEAYLQECLDSIREQSYEKLEIILVDDGSTDNSPAICQTYAQSDKRIRLFRKQNGGLISAWTYGVKKSSGEYVCFVDSDDWIDPDMIEGMLEDTDGSAKEVICGNYIIEKIEKKEAIKVTQGLVPGTYEKEKITEMVIPKLLGNEIRSIHSSRCMKLISRELILDNLKFTNNKITMGEDLNIMYSVFLDAERMVIMAEGHYYHYRYVNSSMVHKYNPELGEKIELLYQTIKKIIISKIQEQEKQQLLLHSLKKEYIFLLFLVIKNELRGPNKDYKKRIQRLIVNARNKELNKVEIRVKSKANKLLYLIWRKPNGLIIGAAKIAISLFDRR